MLTPKHCETVSPQCPSGQEDGYKLGWYQGQIDMVDLHDGTPCQVIEMQQEIERLRYVLSGVRGAIDTGRNEPLMVWRDQVNIAIGEPQDG